MKSFGRLVRTMRGQVPRAEIAERAGLEEAYLEDIESGRITPDERVASRLLRLGFALDTAETRRAILGIQLYDLGLKDNEIRQLVVDVMLGAAPEGVRQQLRRLYARYATDG